MQEGEVYVEGDDMEEMDDMEDFEGLSDGKDVFCWNFPCHVLWTLNASLWTVWGS